MNGHDRFGEVKRRFGAEQLRGLFADRGLVLRGSGRNRARCPQCQDSPREVSIREVDGTGLWKCHHCGIGGSAVDLLVRADEVEKGTALAQLEQLAGVDPTGQRPAPPLRSAAPPPSRPPADEVAELWGSARPITEVIDVAAEWRDRGLDVGTIEERDLARALPWGMKLPRWARHTHLFEPKPWSEDAYRLIVPMFDADGRLVSLHARAASGADPKGVHPVGYEMAGAIMADPLARELLARRASPADVLVGEGVPDFLAWGTHWSDAADDAPALFAVLSGSWSKQIASRIPDGARVLIATHHDAAGEKYAKHIATTLLGRCRGLRWRLPLGSKEAAA